MPKAPSIRLLEREGTGEAWELKAVAGRGRKRVPGNTNYSLYSTSIPTSQRRSLKFKQLNSKSDPLQPNCKPVTEMRYPKYSTSIDIPGRVCCGSRMNLGFVRDNPQSSLEFPPKSKRIVALLKRAVQTHCQSLLWLAVFRLPPRLGCLWIPDGKQFLASLLERYDDTPSVSPRGGDIGFGGSRQSSFPPLSALIPPPSQYKGCYLHCAGSCPSQLAIPLRR